MSTKKSSGKLMSQGAIKLAGDAAFGVVDAASLAALIAQEVKAAKDMPAYLKDALLGTAGTLMDYVEDVQSAATKTDALLTRLGCPGA